MRMVCFDLQKRNTVMIPLPSSFRKSKHCVSTSHKETIQKYAYEKFRLKNSLSKQNRKECIEDRKVLNCWRASGRATIRNQRHFHIQESVNQTKKFSDRLKVSYKITKYFFLHVLPSNISNHSSTQNCQSLLQFESLGTTALFLGENLLKPSVRFGRVGRRWFRRIIFFCQIKVGSSFEIS